MFPSILVCVACLVAEPGDATDVGPGTKTSALTVYDETRAKIGRGADAQVRMALWCEAHGLDSERLKHLAIAVLSDPAHSTARGLLGMVAFHGHWQSPEAISEKLEADHAMRAALADYNGRRARMGNSADSHWKIALWCDEHGLKPQATAHLMMVTQLDPNREAAWKRLGYVKQGGRWATAEQLAAAKTEADAQKKADKYWTTLLAKLRNQLDDKSKQADVINTLKGISDARALPSISAVFAAGDAHHQAIAVQVLGQIGSADSTRALAILAIAGKSAELRSKATQTLRTRNQREIASGLIALLRDPELDPDPILYHYSLRPTGLDGIGSLGILIVQGPLYDVLRTYPLAETRLISAPSGFVPTGPQFGYETRVIQQRQQQSSDLTALIGRILSESEGYILNAQHHVRQVNQLNAQVIGVLAAATGKNLGADREVWRKWWAEEQGYTYDPPPARPRQDLTFSDTKPLFAAEVRVDCFAAGTPVHTLTGLRPIEQIEIGDQVLTQDPCSGTLSYQPVVATVHSRPDKVMKINLNQETITATGIDRFWKVGQGWVMARDLKPGDRLRSLGGISSANSVNESASEPVFNLKVMQAQSFFVGRRGVLVHDNSLVEPVLQPFDTFPELSAIVELTPNSRERPKFDIALSTPR